jgi:hypothetical protein
MAWIWFLWLQIDLSGLVSMAMNLRHINAGEFILTSVVTAIFTKRAVFHRASQRLKCCRYGPHTPCESGGPQAYRSSCGLYSVLRTDIGVTSLINIQRGTDGRLSICSGTPDRLSTLLIYRTGYTAPNLIWYGIYDMIMTYDSSHKTVLYIHNVT